MPRRPIERLEQRILFANQLITNAGSPIREISIEDTGEFQFKTDQVFEESAGDGQIYQFSKPLSSVFVRTEADGFVYGNTSIISNAFPFVSLEPQTIEDLGDGEKLITSVFGPQGGFFEIVQEVTYSPGSVFFRVENRLISLTSIPFDYSIFAYADVNPRGTGLYDPSLGAIASIDADGQPTVVLDPLDGTSVTPSTFHEEGFYSDVRDKIQNGLNLGFTPEFPQPPGFEESDNAVALQWGPDNVPGFGDGLYAFTVGIDPVGGGSEPPPPSTDEDRPFADLRSVSSPNANTRVIEVAYRDSDGVSPSGIDSSTIGAERPLPLRRWIHGQQSFPRHAADHR